MKQNQNNSPAKESLSGYSDLLCGLKDKNRTFPDIQNLILKFRTSNIYLYTIEDGAEYKMMFGVYNRLHSTWRYFLTSGAGARNTVKHLCDQYGYEEHAR